MVVQKVKKNLPVVEEQNGEYDIMSEAVEEYAKEYADQRAIDTTINIVKNVIKNTNCTLDQALDVAGIHGEERERVIEQLQQ